MPKRLLKCAPVIDRPGHQLHAERKIRIFPGYRTMKLKLLLVFILSTLGLNLYAAQPDPHNDYQLICDAFNKNPSNSKDFKNLTREQSIQKINDYIWNNIKSKQANDILSVIASASPDKKYDLLKETIELVTNEKWDCPIMRDY